MELRLRLLLTVAAAAALLAAAPLRAELPALAALQSQGARITAAIVDVGDGRTLESLAPDLRVTPASLTKLVIAAAALDRWPGDRSFVTRLLAGGEIDGGVLRGDLVLRGDGDPALDTEKLGALALQLRARGVTSVTGRLLVQPGPFGTLSCETRDRCEGQLRTDRSYNALLSGIGVDYGNWCIVVRPGDEGAPASVQGCAGATLPLPIEGRVSTGRAGSRETLRIERLTGPGGDRLRVAGSLPPGDAPRIYRAMSDPTLATGQLLRALLGQVGITVAGDAVVAASPASPAASSILAEVESLPLRELVARMMRYSNNYMADVLTANLAAEIDGRPPERLSAAAAVLQAFLARDRQAATIAPASLPVLASGSGLTPENRLSARDLTDLLLREYRDTRHFPAFYGSLVVPRDAPFPYLRRGDAAWLDRVALKTGTLTEPYSVTGIAGYLRKRDGGFLAFAIIVNGSDSRRGIPAAESIAAARDDLVRVLARY